MITSPSELKTWSMRSYVSGREPETMQALYTQDPDGFVALIASAEVFGPRALHYELGILADRMGMADPLAGTALALPAGDALQRQQQAAWASAKGGTKSFSAEGYEPDVPVDFVDNGMLSKAYGKGDTGAADGAGGALGTIATSDIVAGATALVFIAAAVYGSK